MTVAARVAAVAIVALAAWQVAWHAVLSPSTEAQRWAVALFFVAPLLPALGALLVRNRRAAFWGALAALLYFCHGVMVAWATPAERVPALVEIALAIALVAAASWDGVRARFRRRPAAL